MFGGLLSIRLSGYLGQRDGRLAGKAYDAVGHVLAQPRIAVVVAACKRCHRRRSDPSLSIFRSVTRAVVVGFDRNRLASQHFAVRLSQAGAGDASLRSVSAPADHRLDSRRHNSCRVLFHTCSSAVYTNVALGCRPTDQRQSASVSCC